MKAGALPIALIVEDEFLTAMKASAIFSDFGFQPLDVANADQAFHLLKAQGGQVDILFSDVRMPGSMNGFELARRVRAEWPEIKIVVASGVERPKSGELPDGAVFIYKPFSVETIEEHLRTFYADRDLTSASRRH